VRRPFADVYQFGVRFHDRFWQQSVYRPLDRAHEIYRDAA